MNATACFNTVLFLASVVPLGACALSRTESSIDPTAGPNEILFRAANSNWYVRTLDLEGRTVEGRVHRERDGVFRIGQTPVAVAAIVEVHRRIDAPGLDDWKPFALGVAAGGLAGIFSGAVYSGLTEGTYGGGQTARWFAGGVLAGIAAVLASQRGEPQWVQVWIPNRPSAPEAAPTRVQVPPLCQWIAEVRPCATSLGGE